MTEFYICKICGAVLVDLVDSWRKHGMKFHQLNEQSARYNIDGIGNFVTKD